MQHFTRSQCNIAISFVASVTWWMMHDWRCSDEWQDGEHVILQPSHDMPA
jgi:hypothetical protein